MGTRRKSAVGLLRKRFCSGAVFFRGARNGGKRFRQMILKLGMEFDKTVGGQQTIGAVRPVRRGHDFAVLRLELSDEVSFRDSTNPGFHCLRKPKHGFNPPRQRRPLNSSRTLRERSRK